MFLSIWFWFISGFQCRNTSTAAVAAKISLGALRGRKVVLYAYPKDNTPACTEEAIAFNRLRREFADCGTELIGVSPDSVKRHASFKTKHGLDFPLLADEDHAVAEAYGVWQEKTLYGRTSMGIVRSTFLIGADGVIVRAWRKVKVEGHAEAVLAAAKAI